MYSKPVKENGSVSVRPLDTSDMFVTQSVDTVTILLKNNDVLDEAEEHTKKWKVKHGLD